MRRLLWASKKPARARCAVGLNRRSVVGDGIQRARLPGCTMMDSEYSGHRTTANPTPVLRTHVTVEVRGLLDGVVDLVVEPLDREGVCEMRGECLDAEPLGRVVAGGDQVDAEL